MKTKNPHSLETVTERICFYSNEITVLKSRPGKEKEIEVRQKLLNFWNNYKLINHSK